MPDFTHRSTQTELLDKPDIPFEDIRANMAELNTINTWLGGHVITIAGMKAFLFTTDIQSTVKAKRTETSIIVCELGCGGGDNLQAIQHALATSSIRPIGIDINPACIASAKAQYPQLNAQWLTMDYRDAPFDQLPDVLFSSLFCHHFSHEALVAQLQWMYQHCQRGFFINDLHRHPLAYYSIKWLTQCFSASYLVKNDAPISVLRGFTRKEWKQLLQEAGIQHYNIHWKWAFRHLIIVKK